MPIKRKTWYPGRFSGVRLMAIADDACPPSASLVMPVLNQVDLRARPRRMWLAADWVPKRGGLEVSVSREFLPTENRRKCSRSFASKSVKHRPENEFAFSSVRFLTSAWNFGIASMRLARKIRSDGVNSLVLPVGGPI